MTSADLLAFVRKYPISCGGGLLAVALALATYYRSSSVPETTDLLDARSREGTRLESNLRNGAQLPEQVQLLTDSVKQMEARLVNRSELATNLQYFYRLETETGVKLNELQQNTAPTPADPAQKALRPVSFSVAVQGDYPAVLDFIRRLEAGVHYCRINSSSISGSGPDRTGPVKLSLELELLGNP